MVTRNQIKENLKLQTGLHLYKSGFVWPAAKDGKINVTPAQLSMLLEGIDWRMPQKTWRPLKVG
jgi:transposase